MYSKLSNIDLIMGILFVSEILTCLFCIQLGFHMKLIANYHTLNWKYKLSRQNDPANLSLDLVSKYICD